MQANNGAPKNPAQHCPQAEMGSAVQETCQKSWLGFAAKARGTQSFA
jgi:hypothetical protein